MGAGMPLGDMAPALHACVTSHRRHLTAWFLRNMIAVLTPALSGSLQAMHAQSDPTIFIDSVHVQTATARDSAALQV